MRLKQTTRTQNHTRFFRVHRILNVPSNSVVLSLISQLCCKNRAWGGGGGRGPIMANTARLRPKGVPFSGYRYKKRVGISLVEVYKRVGKSVFRYLKGPLIIIFRIDAP